MTYRYKINFCFEAQRSTSGSEVGYSRLFAVSGSELSGSYIEPFCCPGRPSSVSSAGDHGVNMANNRSLFFEGKMCHSASAATAGPQSSYTHTVLRLQLAEADFGSSGVAHNWSKICMDPGRLHSWLGG